MLPVTESQVSPASSLQFFFEGDDYFSALETAMERATQTLDLEFYYFASDELGWHFCNLLIRKAREGIRVRIIFDAVGCRSTSISLFDALEKAAVPYKIYNPILPFWRHLGRRNHRKTAIVDSSIGFLGGFNLAAEYSRKYSGEKAWRDTGVKVERPELVQDLLGLFEDAWEERKTGLRTFLRNRRWKPRLKPGNLHIVPNFGFRRKSLIRREYLTAIKRARRSIDVCNPYFVPDHGILRALKKAARRGVSLRILTVGGETDVPLARWAGHAIYSQLLKAGAQIFEYQERMMHAKCAVVDKSWFTIGTANFDHLSFFKNLEVNLFGWDEMAAETLYRQFEKDLESSRQIHRQEWKKRSWVTKLRERFFFWFREWM